MFRRCGATSGLRVPFIAASASGSSVRWSTSASIPPLTGAFEPLTVGHFKQAARRSSETQTKMSDIIGPGAGGNTVLSPIDSTPVRLGAGECLGLMDLCAAQTALRHMLKAGKRLASPDSPCGSSINANDSLKIGCATVACSDMSFRFPLVQGDMVHVYGTIVACGKSSITVSVDVFRTQFPLKSEQCVAGAFFHMVAIDEQLRTVPCVPGVILDTPEHYQTHLAATHRPKAQELEIKERLLQLDPKNFKDRLTLANGDATKVAELTTQLEGIETELNKKKTVRVHMKDTVTSANRIFFPGHLNLNNTIFGGELLRWMEMHAVHCGRCFTQNKRVFSVGMHEVTFKKPVKREDWVTLEASVVYVQNTTMVVDVKLFVESSDDGTVTTNEASFVMTNFDEVGHLQPIEKGLKLPQGAEAMEKMLLNHRPNGTDDDLQLTATSKLPKSSWAELDWVLKYARAKLKYQHLYTKGRTNMSHSFRSVKHV